MWKYIYWKANISPSGAKWEIKKNKKQQKQKRQHVKYAVDNK